MSRDTLENYGHYIILVEDDDDKANILAGYFMLAKFKVYKTKTVEERLNKMNELDNKIDLALVN
jgi:DNA-binding response OmpR family regulator